MNESQIYTAQVILMRHYLLRDLLHTCSQIIPDDQRIINDLHSKFCSFMSAGVPVDMKEFETVYENLRVLFAEYEKDNDIDAYSNHCFTLIFAAIEMFGKKDSGIDDMVYYNSLSF